MTNTEPLDLDAIEKRISGAAQCDVTAAVLASLDDVPALVQEVRRLREREERAWKSDDFEIVNGWLVERGVLPLDYPAGVEYGAMPYSDAEPVLDLKTITGWPEQTAEETR